jgi:hypothetical protein
MGGGLIVERTHDKALIKSVMTMPEIWEAVSEDGQDSQNFEPETESDCWLAIKDDSLTVGLYNLHPENRSTLEAHIQMIPEHRKEYSVKAGAAFLLWFAGECPAQYQKLIVKIPSLYPNVRKFVQSFGLAKRCGRPQSRGKSLFGRVLSRLGVTSCLCLTRPSRIECLALSRL